MNSILPLLQTAWKTKLDSIALKAGPGEERTRAYKYSADRMADGWLEVDVCEGNVLSGAGICFLKSLTCLFLKRLY